MSKQETLLKTLQSGASLTAAQIRSRFGVKNPAGAVKNLRDQGYCVYANSATVSGKEVVKYRIGTPTKRMVAIASRMFGASVFSA